MIDRHIPGYLLRRGLLIPLLAAVSLAASAEPARIAVASSLRFAMPALLDAFHADTDARVSPSYGASGNLLRQIVQGAPFELFFAADEWHVEALHRRGVTADTGVVYATGRLVLIASTNSPLKPEQGLAGVARLLAAGEIRRFAIANPEHAPYGRAAREALEHAGLWETLSGRLITGENVSQAAQFALSPDVDGGIVAESLAVAPEVAGRSVSAALPLETHSPLRHRMVELPDASESALAFMRFMGTGRAVEVLEGHGFHAP